MPAEQSRSLDIHDTLTSLHTRLVVNARAEQFGRSFREVIILGKTPDQEVLYVGSLAQVNFWENLNKRVHGGRKKVTIAEVLDYKFKARFPSRLALSQSPMDFEHIKSIFSHEDSDKLLLGYYVECPEGGGIVTSQKEVGALWVPFESLEESNWKLFERTRA